MAPYRHPRHWESDPSLFKPFDPTPSNHPKLGDETQLRSEQSGVELPDDPDDEVEPPIDLADGTEEEKPKPTRKRRSTKRSVALHGMSWGRTSPELLIPDVGRRLRALLCAHCSFALTAWAFLITDIWKRPNWQSQLSVSNLLYASGWFVGTNDRISSSSSWKWALVLSKRMFSSLLWGELYQLLIGR